MNRKPMPEVGQWWALNGHAGRIVKILPGGGADMGIAVFDGAAPPAHVSTMLHYPGWAQVAAPSALPPPCTCRTLDGGVILSDGCPAHDAAARAAARVEEGAPMHMMRR